VVHFEQLRADRRRWFQIDTLDPAFPSARSVRAAAVTSESDGGSALYRLPRRRIFICITRVLMPRQRQLPGTRLTKAMRVVPSRRPAPAGASPVRSAGAINADRRAFSGTSPPGFEDIRRRLPPAVRHPVPAPSSSQVESVARGTRRWRHSFRRETTARAQWRRFAPARWLPSPCAGSPAPHDGSDQETRGEPSSRPVRQDAIPESPPPSPEDKSRKERRVGNDRKTDRTKDAKERTP
jgi:hypothetical protein